MLKIKQTGPAKDAGYSSCGEAHMRRVSDKTARALCGMYPTPAMGYETVVAFAKDKTWSDVKHRLMIQNVSGVFFVACSSVTIDAWPDVFKVEIVQ